MTTVSTIDLSTTGPAPAAAILSPAEAGAAVRSLTAADKIALTKIARLYAKKTPYDHEDLLQEAICRVLDGARAWPRHLAALPFLPSLFGGKWGGPALAAPYLRSNLWSRWPPLPW